MVIDELDKEDTFYAKKVLNNKDIHSLLDSLDIYCMYYHSCCISNYNFQSLPCFRFIFKMQYCVLFFVQYVPYSYLSNILTAKADLDHFNYHRISLAITELYGI